MKNLLDLRSSLRSLVGQIFVAQEILCISLRVKNPKGILNTRKSKISDIYNKRGYKIKPVNKTETLIVDALISSQSAILKEYLSELSKDDIIDFFIEYIQKRKEPLMRIPISIFKVKELSALELIVKYLKENLKLTNIKISNLINRSPQTIFTTYKNSKKKYTKSLPIEFSIYDLPLKIFKQRKLSTLETIVSYLKDNFDLSFHAIALMLNKDDRTIWTVYNRGKKKK